MGVAGSPRRHIECRTNVFITMRITPPIRIGSKTNVLIYNRRCHMSMHRAAVPQSLSNQIYSPGCKRRILRFHPSA